MEQAPGLHYAVLQLKQEVTSIALKHEVDGGQTGAYIYWSITSPVLTMAI